MNYLKKLFDDDKFILHWQITRKCNYCCSYCIQGMGRETPKDEISLEEQCVVINECIKMIQEAYPQKRIELYLMGGEATLMDLDYVFQTVTPINVHLVTNGWREAEYYIDLVNKYPQLTWLTFSVHQEYHNLDEYAEKLDKIRQCGRRIKISVNIPTSLDNHDGSQEWIKKLEQIPDIKLNPTVIRDLDGKVPDKNCNMNDIFKERKDYIIDGELYSRYEALEYMKNVDTYGMNCNINQMMLKIKPSGCVGRRCHGQYVHNSKPEEVFNTIIKCESHTCNLCKTGKIYKDEYIDYV